VFLVNIIYIFFVRAYIQDIKTLEHNDYQNQSLLVNVRNILTWVTRRVT